MQAEDYDQRVGRPRRERKLEETEKKMRYIRGFVGEGETVGGRGEGVSRLLDDQSQSVEERTQSGGSHDSHVTSDDVTGEGDQSGKQIWIAVQLPSGKSLQSQFYTSQTIKVSFTSGHSC